MHFQYTEAPNNPDLSKYDWDRTIFLAGSITGAWNWQEVAAKKLLPYFNVLNPRRLLFDVSNPKVEREQIQWEHNYLCRCEYILFFFSNETLAPITLLEYGAALEEAKIKTYRKIYTAIHPDYKRKNDVIIQTELRNPEFSKNITFSLDETIQQIINNIK